MGGGRPKMWKIQLLGLPRGKLHFFLLGMSSQAGVQLGRFGCINFAYTLCMDDWESNMGLYKARVKEIWLLFNGKTGLISVLLMYISMPVIFLGVFCTAFDSRIKQAAKMNNVWSVENILGIVNKCVKAREPEARDQRIAVKDHL